MSPGPFHPGPSHPGFPRLGAFPDASGDTTTFRVWAPNAERVDVAVGEEVHPLEASTHGAHGVYAATVPARPGDDYAFVLDGDRRLPDPWSRAQPYGLRGDSRVVDPVALRGNALTPGGAAGAAKDLRRPVALEELVIYELHVGTFSPDGTFDGVVPRLPQLRDLGITAIEIMPVATFPGRHGWGYDGVYAYAPHPTYGGPDGLARLIAAAHEADLGVILDVVYNHFGAGSDAITAFGPYLTDDGEPTIWGDAVDYTQRAVREWACQNAEMWVGEYGVDGLRLDAVHAIVDHEIPHVMAELAARVKAIDPRALVISEMEIGDLRPIEAWGHDAQWEDALHHAVHVLLTGEHEGYYAHYGRVQDVADELTRPERRRFVVCDQNHDQVGNRALGDRLHGRDLRLAQFCSILSDGTPMLFEGEEYDEPHPFQYFTDHIDPTIAQMTREGRRAEFSAFSDFSAEEIPDPQDPETFERSKLDPTGGDPGHFDHVRRLLALRRQLGDAPVTDVAVDEEQRVLSFRRGGYAFMANFSDTEQDGVPARSGITRPAANGDTEITP